MANSAVLFKKISLAKFNELTTKDNSTFYRVDLGENKEDFYLGDKKLNNSQEITDAINNLDTTADVVIANVTDGVVTLTKAIKEENGIISAVSGTDTTIAFAKVATTGAASDVTTTVIEVGTEDAKVTFAPASNVQTVLQTIADKLNSADENATITIDKTPGGTDDDFVTKYSFKQGGVAIPNGEITIGKDMVATSGELVKADGEGTAGIFIKMTIASGQPFYIDVKDLVEFNTYEDTTEIKVTAVEGKTHTYQFNVGEIAASKIIYKTEGETKTSVATELDNINAKLTSGIEDLDGTATIATRANNTITLKAGIVETDGVIANDTNPDIVLADVASTGKAADVAIDTTSTLYEEGKTENVEQALTAVVGKIADGAKTAIEALDTTEDVGIASVKDNVVTIKGSIAEENGIIKQGAASDVVLEKVATTGAASDVTYVNNTASLKTNLTATNTQSAIDELVGYESDTSASTSIAGAKKYADEAVANKLVWEEVE